MRIIFMELFSRKGLALLAAGYLAIGVGASIAAYSWRDLVTPKIIFSTSTITENAARQEAEDSRHVAASKLDTIISRDVGIPRVWARLIGECDASVECFIQANYGNALRVMKTYRTIPLEIRSVTSMLTRFQVYNQLNHFSVDDRPFFDEDSGLIVRSYLDFPVYDKHGKVHEGLFNGRDMISITKPGEPFTLDIYLNDGLVSGLKVSGPLFFTGNIPERRSVLLFDEENLRYARQIVRNIYGGLVEMDTALAKTLNVPER
ncbi:hypothetical protein HYV81_05255 [Candidatus Woesearchaeota archaeon]|nr:hypothetical protein [Candidatus Woesearchaeota archaeon]